MLRSRLVACRSVAANPSISPTAIGKNVTRAITTTFGQQPEPEPDDQQRGDRDDRQRLRGHQQRGERAAQPRREVHRDRERPAQRQRHREPDRGDLQRRHGVGPDLRRGTPSPAPAPAAARAAPAAAPRTRSTYHCQTTSPAARAPAAAPRAPAPAAPAARRGSGRTAARVRRPSRVSPALRPGESGVSSGRVPRSGSRGEVVVGEPGREVRPRGQRLAVGAGQHAGVEHEPRVPRPLAQASACPTRPVSSRRYRSASISLAARHQLRLGERAGVGVHQQLGGAAPGRRRRAGSRAARPARTAAPGPGAPAARACCRSSSTL